MQRPIDHQRWTSENADDRAIAARWCAGCQVLDLCGDAAEERGANGASGQASTAPRSADPGSADYSKSAQISVVGPLLLTTVKTPPASTV